MYYHVTDRASVPSIIREGLKPDPYDAKPFVWVFDDLDTAKRAGKRWTWSYAKGPAILKVNMDGLNLERDECRCGSMTGCWDKTQPQHAWKHLGTIPPERITVHQERIGE